MSSRMEQILKKRERLVAVAEMQRAQVALCYVHLERPARAAQSAGSILNSLRKSPIFLTIAAGLLMKTRWKRLAKLPSLLWKGWNLIKIYQLFRTRK